MMVLAFALLCACGGASSGGDTASGAQSVVVTPPTPAPAPPPPVVAPAPSATLNGEASIADNFDVASGLQVSDETPSVAPDPTGAFRFLCGAGQLLKDDPLVYPGQPGAAHLHQFFGNTAANAHSTYASLRTTGGTTCGDSASPLQRSSYWVPAMLDGVGNAVKPDYMLTYYKALPSSHPACGAPDATHLGHCIGLPNGLRFIFGYDMRTMTGGPTDVNSSDYWAFAYECVAFTGAGIEVGRHRTMAAVVAEGKCPLDRGYLRVAASIPQCWDGRNLDSADHRSHMAYATEGGIAGLGRACPTTHPYKIPEIAVSIFIKIDANFLAGKWRLSSDEMHPGTVPGTTLHMDYWEAWSPPVKAAWQTGCIDKHLSCNNGQLGNGQQIKGMATPPGGWPVGVKVPLSQFSSSPSPAPAPAPAPTPAPAPAPAPSTTTCPDGSVIPSSQVCPTPTPFTATIVCPDGNIILATKKCPPKRKKPVMRELKTTGVGRLLVFDDPGIVGSR